MMKRKTISLIAAVALLVGLFSIPAQAATPEEIEDSIELGLPWLVSQQNLDGSWLGAGNYEVPTGLALYKLCERAYELNDPDIESPFDPDYEYSDQVILGFQWVFNHLQAVSISTQDHTGGATGSIDDPDSNGNGVGVVAQYNTFRETYSTAGLLIAIAASRMPSRPVESLMAYDPLATYGSVAQDMVDWLAFGQVDKAMDQYSSYKEGGWDYFNVNNGAGGSSWKGDQSNSGYATLGLAAAQDFGSTIPEWVKVELDWWINFIQAADGGSYYGNPIDFVGENLLKTGNLISQMALVGDDPSTPRVVNALAYLENHWNDPSGWYPNNGWLSTNPIYASDYQTMFCLMKALVYMGIDTFGIGPIDWFDEISDQIILEQDPTGGWLMYGPWEGGGSPVLSTTWALLTLEKIAPPPPIKIDVSKHWSYTNVCFERDNDLDGEFNEDPVDFEDLDGDGIAESPIDNDGDGLYNEDDVDCPDGTYLGDSLPAINLDDEDPDNDTYLLEAVVGKNEKVSSYNPGQFYAVSTVNVLSDIEQLTIVEDYDEVITSEIGVLNPAKGGGRLVVVKVGSDGVACQILDANMPGVSFDGNVATVELGPQEADTTILVYVKFGPGIKTWTGPLTATNYNGASTAVDPVYNDDFIMAQAMLSLDAK